MVFSSSPVLRLAVAALVCPAAAASGAASTVLSSPLRSVPAAASTAAPRKDVSSSSTSPKKPADFLEGNENQKVAKAEQKKVAQEVKSTVEKSEAEEAEQVKTNSTSNAASVPFRGALKNSMWTKMMTDGVNKPNCTDYKKNGVGPVTDQASCREACQTGEGLSEVCGRLANYNPERKSCTCFAGKNCNDHSSYRTICLTSSSSMRAEWRMIGMAVALMFLFALTTNVKV
ncbi:unnamed protein product [Amoebophrya sp. A25]|nr:unnamed protein product [Amoebophrya sp. A25]|eukprot:GSA25T00007729001.1